MPGEEKDSKSWLWKVIGAVIIIVSLFGGFKGLEAHFVTKEVNELQFASMAKTLQRINLNSEVVFFQQNLSYKRSQEEKAKYEFEKNPNNPILRQEWLNKIKDREKAEDALKRAEELRRKCP